MRLQIFDIKGNGRFLKEVDFTGVVPQIGDHVIDSEDYVLKVHGRCIDLNIADFVYLYVEVIPVPKKGDENEGDKVQRIQ